MEPELKTYLEGLEGRIDRQFDEVNNRLNLTHEQLISIREEMATKDDLAEQIGDVMEISSKILGEVKSEQKTLEGRVTKLETKLA